MSKDVPLNRTFDLQGRVRVQIFTLEDVYVCNLSRTVGVRRRGVQRQKTRSPVTAERWRRRARRLETRSPIVFDDFIGLAFQRGIGATRPPGGVCRSVGRTCDGHAMSSRVRRDGRGGARAPSPLSLPFRVRDRGR